MMGNSGFLLCWPREVQSSIRVVRESGGLLSSDPSYFCVVCCDFSIFTSNFVDLILLPFILDESG